jgi:hypothetical protein
MLTLLQDWTTIQGTASSSIAQSGSKWLNLEGYRDVFFWLEVSALTTVGTELYMNYETAPVMEPTLFTPMVSEFLMTTSSTPVLTKVLLSQNPTCPLAGLVRWRIRPNAAAGWKVTFRIHCLGKWKG